MQKKRPLIQEAIVNGLNDLYIHRQKCASFFNIYCPILDLHACLVIAEFLPRHQFPTEKITRFLGNISPVNIGADMKETQQELNLSLNNNSLSLNDDDEDGMHGNISLNYENATMDLIDRYQQSFLSDEEFEEEKDILSNNTPDARHCNKISSILKHNRELDQERQKQYMYHQHFFL